MGSFWDLVPLETNRRKTNTKKKNWTNENSTIWNIQWNILAITEVRLAIKGKWDESKEKVFCCDLFYSVLTRKVLTELGGEHMLLLKDCMCWSSSACTFGIQLVPWMQSQVHFFNICVHVGPSAVIKCSEHRVIKIYAIFWQFRGTQGTQSESEKMFNLTCLL